MIAAHTAGADNVDAAELFATLGRQLLGTGPSNPDHLLEPRSLHGRQVARFVVSRGGKPVARCAAIVDPAQSAGLIGFFAAVDDRDASAAVLDLACDWLARRGVTEVTGPVNLSIWHGYRFMTGGFDTEPFLGEPRNPAHYPEHFAACGFEPCASYRSWDVSPQQLRYMARAARSHCANGAFTARPLDLTRFDDEIEILWSLVRECFADNVGFAPISLREFRSIFGRLRPLLRSEMTRVVADDSGALVGFGHSYPDTVSGRAVLHTIALAPRVRRLGIVAAHLIAPAFEYMVEHLGSAVGGLAVDGPTIFDKIGAPTRHYNLFSRRL